MDFTNRSPQTVPSPGPHPQVAGPASKQFGKKHRKYNWNHIGVIASLFCVVVLLVGIILLIYSNNNNTKDTESSYIYSNRLQAVFLNTGQVYFGNISVLNNNFVVLAHIFYLQTSSNSSSTTSSSSNNNVSLVKLGCELHMPYDQMVINRTQVTFWENLQPGGQVAKAVSTWDNEHPNGQQCSDQSSSSSTNSGSTVQPAPTQ
jgi:hypothetical protein